MASAPYDRKSVFVVPNLGFSLTGAVVLVVAALLTRAMIWLDIRDMPNRRSSHDRPTPKSGGVAIAVAFVFGLIALYWLQSLSQPGMGMYPSQFALFAALASVIAAVAFLDDLFDLVPFSKLIAQFGAASFFAIYIAHIDTIILPGMGPVLLGTGGYVLTVVWIVFFMNAFNFMDGINGIAAGSAVIACLFLGFIAASEDAYFVVISCLCLGSAALGFLVYNFPHGRIFMGDAGSQFIGFVMASLAVFGKSVDEARLSIYLVPVIFFPFIFDVVITLVYRALRGQNILKAHRDHLYQIAVKLDASHVQVSLAYFVLIGLCGVVAIAVQAADPTGRLLLIAALFPVFFVLAGFVYRLGLRARVVEPFFRRSNLD